MAYLPSHLQNVDYSKFDTPTRIAIKDLLIPLYNVFFIDWENPDGTVITEQKVQDVEEYRSIVLNQIDEYLHNLHNYQLAKDEMDRATHRAEIKAKNEALAKIAGTIVEEMNMYALTIAPEDKYATLPELSAMIQYINKATCVSRSKWCFEQRSENINDIYGIHVHMVICSTFPISRIRQYIIDQRLKKKWKFSCPNRALWLTPVYNLDFENNYMSGFKHDSDKEKKSEIDIIWRQINCLEETYEYIRT